MNKLPPDVEELLREFQSGTMFPFSETLNRAAFIIKSEFLPLSLIHISEPTRPCH
jgi:hypothetical protein